METVVQGELCGRAVLVHGVDGDSAAAYGVGAETGDPDACAGLVGGEVRDVADDVGGGAAVKDPGIREAVDAGQGLLGALGRKDGLDEPAPDIAIKACSKDAVPEVF